MTSIHRSIVSIKVLWKCSKVKSQEPRKGNVNCLKLSHRNKSQRIFFYFNKFVYVGCWCWNLNVVFRLSSADHPEDDDDGRIMEDSELKTKFSKIIRNNIVLKMDLVTSVSNIFVCLLSASVLPVTTKTCDRSKKKKYDNIPNWKNDDKPDCCWFSNSIMQNNYHFKSRNCV